MTAFRRLLAVSLVLLAGAGPAAAMDIQRVHSPSGVEAWLIEDHTNPIVAMKFYFRGGSALDPGEKQGLARMAAGLLDEGAGDLDRGAFQGRLDALSITLRFSAERDSFGGEIRTLSETRETAFDLMRLALTAPRFDSEPVERIRGQILADLRQKSERPGDIADNALYRTLFPDHSYGWPDDGTEAGVKAVTVADLRGFARRRLGRDNLLIGVVGDVRADELATLLERTFASLPAHASPWELKEVQPGAAGGLEVIGKAIPQSAITFAQKGLKRDDPDYYAAYVLNHILGGGGFTSRIYDEVREKRGLAYSVHTTLLPFAHAGLLTGAAGTANVGVSETLKVVREEWRRMAESGVTPEELADAKLYLTGSFPLRFSSSTRIAAILAATQFERLGIDYLDRRNALIEAVTLEQVNDVARRLLDPEALTFVVVGKPEGVESRPSPPRTNGIRPAPPRR